MENLDPEAAEYFRYHQYRYRYLLEILAPMLEGPMRVLDIGLSAFPRMLAARHPGLRIATLGFDDSRYRKPDEWPHFACNLNDRGFDWSAVGAYDVVILAEVIEHLATPPQVVLRALRSILEPAGRLVIQTPNAASLAKRVALARGRNPYEMIRDNPMDPGHLREYTVDELRRLASECGFQVAHVSVRNYFHLPTRRGRFWSRVGSLLPPALRDGITMVLVRR